MATSPVDQPQVIELQKPIVWDNATISRLTVQPPTANEFWSFNLPAQKEGAKMPAGELLAIGAKCCGLPEAAIRKLSLHDAFALIGVVTGFL